MTFSEQVVNEVCAPTDRILCLDETDAFELSKLEKAIIVLHTIWSGPSVKVLKEYSAAYYRLFDFDRSIKFYVINFDKMTPVLIKKFPGPFGGNGESFIVKKGFIISSFPHYAEAFEHELAKAFNE